MYVRFVEEFTGVPVKWIGTGRKHPYSTNIPEFLVRERELGFHVTDIL